MTNSVETNANACFLSKHKTPKYFKKKTYEFLSPKNGRSTKKFIVAPANKER
jgi:hypothetical protein